MATRKGQAENAARQVRKSLMVDADKLERARKLLGASSDSETLRMALDQVLKGAATAHPEEE